MNTTCSFQQTLTVVDNCNCSLDWTTPASIGNCRLRIKGYFDGLISNCPGATPSGAPTWDGTFPNILVLFSELYKTNDPVRIQGKATSPNGNTMSFAAGTWTIILTDDTFATIWTGTLVAACPIGVFTQGGLQCAAGPATLTIEGYSL